MRVEAVIFDCDGVQAGAAGGAVVFGYCERNDPRTLLAHGASAVFADMHRLPDLLSH
jgi:beta-phosphoglucomutase-like phosphatase (HAD superfamily)